MVRDTATLGLLATGARKQRHVVLTGDLTHHRVSLPIDFDEGTTVTMPVDRYSVTSDVHGLGGWRKEAELSSKSLLPPIYDPKSKQDPPLKSSAEEGDEPGEAPALRVKTRLGIAGRLSALSRWPDSAKEDVYLDHDAEDILFTLLPARVDAKGGHPGMLETLAEVGLGVAAKVVHDVTVSTAQGPTNPAPAPAPSRAMPERLPAAPPTVPPLPTGAEASAKSEKPPEKVPPRLVPSPLPRDPEKLRALLARLLEDVDLLVLDNQDMAGLLHEPELAAVVAQYVASGGTLFGYVSEPGDYRSILGAPLTVERKSSKTNRFELAPGDVRGIDLHFHKEKIKVRSKRELPRLAELDRGWQVVAFTSGRDDPRIVERCDPGKGGCVILWGERPDELHGWGGNPVPDIEAARAEIERHVLGRARYLMYRRYDSAGEDRLRAEHALGF